MQLGALSAAVRILSRRSHYEISAAAAAAAKSAEMNIVLICSRIIIGVYRFAPTINTS
eukprot:COSAG01_NODE_1883_length_8988_cov_67.877264_9_plen_58_part_00